MSTCAIVILNYNGRETLATFLPSVLEHSMYPIWIIDNGSTDTSVSFLEENYPQIKLLLSDKNHGYAGGYNWGLAQLKNDYDYYILLNSDVEVSKSWDSGLVEALEKRPGYAAFQPKILSYSDKKTFDYAGAGGGFLDAYGYPFCRGRIFDKIEEDHGQYDDVIDVDWASGACCIIRSNIFHELEGFDPSFFAHMEEIDLCWRMRKSGWRIGYRGDVHVFHLGGGTLARSSPKKLYLNIRNSLTMIYKNESSGQFRKIYRVKYFLEHLAAFQFRLKGKKEFASAIIDGYKDFNKSKSQVKKNNSLVNWSGAIQSQSPVKLVVWQSQVMGKKKFTDL